MTNALFDLAGRSALVIGADAGTAVPAHSCFSPPTSPVRCCRWTAAW